MKAIIEEGKELVMENILSLRKKMKQQEVNEEMIKIEKFLEVNGVKRIGAIVSCTHGLENNNVVDLEILVPINNKIELPSEYKFKPIFKLVNALYIRHKGNPALLQNIYNELITYIRKNGFQEITSGYNVAVIDMKPGMSMDELVTDVYIGISGNVL